MDAKARLVLAAGSVVSLFALGGCEKLQVSTAEPDRKVTSELDRAQLEAAASESNSSPLLRSAAHSRLGAQRHEQGTHAASLAQIHHLDLVRLGWRASNFSLMVQETLKSSQAVNAYEPSASIEKAESLIGDLRGTSDRLTRRLETAEGLELATLTGVQASIDKLNHQIAEVRKEIDALETTRQQAAQQAQELEAKSADAKGQESVDVYRQAVEAKRAAANAATAIDAATMKLLPLQQSLASAEVHKESLAASIQQLDGLKNEVSRGWEEVRKEVSARSNVAASVAGKQPVANQSTLLITVKEIEGLAQELNKHYQRAAEAFEKAAASESAASVAAADAFKRAGSMAAAYQGRPEQKLYKSVQDAANVSGMKLNQTATQHALGRTYADWAMATKLRQDAIKALSDVSQPVKVSLPAEANAEQLARESAELLAKAEEQLNKAHADFDGLATGTATPELKQAALIGQVASKLALAQVSRQQGQLGAARDHTEAAKVSARNVMAAASGTPVPSLIQELAGQ